MFSETDSVDLRSFIIAFSIAFKNVIVNFCPS